MCESRRERERENGLEMRYVPAAAAVADSAVADLEEGLEEVGSAVGVEEEGLAVDLAVAEVVVAREPYQRLAPRSKHKLMPTGCRLDRMQTYPRAKSEQRNMSNRKAKTVKMVTRSATHTPIW